MQTAHSFGGYLFGKNLKVCRENVPSNFKLKDVREGYKSAELLSVSRRKEEIIPNTIPHRIKNLVGLEYSAKYLGSSGYSMGEECTVFVGGVRVSYYDTCKTYSGRASRYRPTYGKLTLNLSIRDAYNTRLIGGLLTTVGNKISRDFYEVTWYSVDGYKGNAYVASIKGYLYKDYHFLASDIHHAKKILKERKELEKKRKTNEKALKRRDDRTWVTYQDSIDAGNCVPGTDSFVSRLRLDLSKIGAVRADVVRAKGFTHNVQSYVHRAINQAKLRYVSK